METQRLLNEPAPGISASPSEDNMRYSNVMILGPTQSPYEEKNVELGEDYTIFSLIDGVVKFEKFGSDRKKGECLPTRSAT
ncbi:hypothetical protein HN51_000696 [Arachis hypogaea]